MFTTEVHKQVKQTMCLYIYTNAPTSNMAKYRAQHVKSAPEFLNYSARVHLACHRIPDPPLVKPLTPASGVLCMTQVTQHRINYRKNDQKNFPRRPRSPAISDHGIRGSLSYDVSRDCYKESTLPEHKVPQTSSC